MDPLHVHQFWGLSPAVDLLSCITGSYDDDDGGGGDSGSNSSPAPQQRQPTSILQVCPYDCRHTLTTIASVLRQQRAADNAVSPRTNQAQPALDLWVYEPEPQLLARHVLLLALLYDTDLTPRERAEAFLELHGNVLLRPRTADWLRAASVQLEGLVANELTAASPLAASLAVFDLTSLRFRELDALLETFQQLRSKASFDMAQAWDARCRKWFGDRYDARHNLIDWDYHMQLAPRGTPFLDPSVGSIIHFLHFRHWRLTGVAHELRQSSYTAANTTLLTTAYGRTHEYKDRNLHDVGRSVAALGFWGDVLNPPHHAFGTVADDPALFKLANTQFSHTAVDVAEHNTLGLIAALCGTTGQGSGRSSSSSSSSSANTKEAHRANAASGPTSMQHLTGDAQQQMLRSCRSDQQQDGGCSACSSSQGTAASDSKQACPCAPPPPAEQHQQDAAQLTDALRCLTSSVRIRLVTGDFKRCLAAARRDQGSSSGGFACATIGHRHVHLLGAEHGLASCMAPGARVLLETAHNMLQLSAKQVAAFEEAALKLAHDGGFAALPARGQGKGEGAAGGPWQPPTGHLMLAVAGRDGGGSNTTAP